ncbi:helix-turn-helix transcriptional regulator [Caulobacter sp. Root343]|uniref:helix-turn-helix domain-containing protein n=1 Tax=Caulobacter sp. Root343 TaxID=1736520 RepID=UPI0006F68BD0|nr:helix-turn-helix transcriptional regulator [Caulobacter sp. Root343]KQV66609.1 hypothetical protein ASC70_12305 [Caulobacter sp. Root343]
MSTTDAKTRQKNREAGARLKASREGAGYETATDAAEALGLSRNTYIQHENGTSPFSRKKAEVFAKKFRTTPEFLMFGPSERMGRIVGKLGAMPDDSVAFTSGQAREYAPIPPGASEDVVILKVEGHAYRSVVDDGSLIYYDERLPEPTKDMLHRLVFCQLESGEIVFKRLMKGSNKDVYDLQSLQAPTLEDQRLVWVAHIAWIAPPHQAEKIIRLDHTAA